MDSLSTINPTAATAGREDSKIDELRMMSLNSKKEMSDKQMRKVANHFENVIYRMLVKEMRKTVPEDGFMEKSHSMEMYMDIADDFMVESLTDNHDMGIESAIYDELKENQKNIVSPEDFEKHKNEFVPLNGNNGETNNRFIPVNTDPAFIDINKKGNWINIPPQDSGLMPLPQNRRMNSSWIDRKN